MDCEIKTPRLPEKIARILSGRNATAQLVECVLQSWPEHERYIEKSLAARDQAVLGATEILARAALSLAGDRLAEIAGNYRWTCDRLREEELFFHREGRYRLATFAEANEEVYSDAAYMQKYVDGLLLTHILWFNHAASCSYFFQTAPGLLATGARMLEIGPGHGLMTYLAMRDFDLVSAVAWDLSPVSVEQTRQALALLGFKDVTCAVQDAMTVRPGEETFDFIVLSEVLEHIEEPLSVMRQVRGIVSEKGLIFVNVPINSPSPDHLYLMRTPDEARRLLTDSGFDIVDEALFATQGMQLDRALRNSVSVSVCMFARPA